MSPRRLLRIVLSVVIIILVWTRIGREWSGRSSLWLAGALILSVILLLVVIAEVAGMQQRWRRMRDQVPKKPLGLDS